MAPRKAAAPKADDKANGTAAPVRKSARSAMKRDPQNTGEKPTTLAPKSAKVTKPVAKANTAAKRNGETRADKSKSTKANGTATKVAAAKPAAKASPRKITSSKAPSKVKKRTPSKKAKSEEEDKENYPVSNGEAKAEKLVPQSRKRKAEEEPTAPPAPKIPKKGKIINQVIHKQNLNVFVCGEGTSGELGLGVTKKDIDVKRPRLNKNLDANNVGVVKIATGGMHNVALTHDNQILTWGVNDNGALGRDTAWDGGLKDMKEDDKSESSSDSGDDTGMNPRETMPTAIPKECFHENTVFIDVAAGDSVSFALTDDGKVWGWGTFRSNEGVMGFTKETIGQAQMTPVLIPQLKKIKQLACGANHALAVDADGRVFAWGSGQQDQLGRRITERSKVNALVPTAVSLKQRGKRSNAKVASVACGDYHSFAIDSGCNVWAWGANSWGETGIFDNAGDDNATILAPELIESLKEDNPSREIVHVAGGAHHSVAVSSDGECLIWGRVDGAQSGIKVSDLPKGDIKYDNGGNENNAKAGAEKPRGNPKILMKPTPVPNVNATMAACGPDHTIAITRDGKAYSWGFSANYQTGQGTDEDVEVASLIDNTAVREKKLNWAGAGGQFSVFTAPVDVMTNGI